MTTRSMEAAYQGCKSHFKVIFDNVKRIECFLECCWHFIEFSPGCMEKLES